MNAVFEERLISYLAGDEPESYEEELFAAAAEDGADASMIRAHVSLRAGLFALDQLGLLDNFITRAMVERIQSSTAQVVQLYDMGSSGALSDVRPDDDADVFISRWVLGDMSAAVAIDLETYVGGALIKTIAELEFDPVDDSIYTCCSGTLARQIHDLMVGLPGRRVCFVARLADGDSRVLAEYVRPDPTD